MSPSDRYFTSRLTRSLRRRRVLLLFVLLNAVLVATACPFVFKPRTVSFSGWIVTETGHPIAEARVAVNTSTATTRKDGRFRLEVRKAESYRLAIGHPDFADVYHTTRTALNGQVWTLTRARISEVDPRGSITLVDDRPELAVKGLEGAVLTLPPNALVDSRDNPPTGLVRAAIATLDLTKGEGPTDWGVRAPNGREGFLVSYGVVFIQFTNPTGTTTYQLRSGMTGQLSLPVLPTMQAHVNAAPQQQFWYFDPQDGYWHMAGQATYDPASGAYRGSVNHLSTLNTDIAKFGDAACLAITLDASIPTGHKLRIRYHSGGTAFGQVPVFVMNDPVNAAYRLPANTNVLLELLNASDEVFGNLVVEDPAGNPLVNTVVNTGAPLPPGSSLWPPSPYTACKPITLKFGSPEVEIRINELLTGILPKDNPTDDYLTWAPTFALARLTTAMGSGVNIVLTNDSPTIGGNVRFAAPQDPWPVNTTATATTLALTLPADGSWVPFVVAGEFGTPSINDKDAIIQAHQNSATGPVLGTKALMVRIRKNANNLTASERDRFLYAWWNFRKKIGGLNYLVAQEMHRLATQAGDEAHMQPAFLTWHRAFLLLVERELQKIDPSVALHYWNWDAAAPNVFAENFMGAPGAGGFGTAEPVFSGSNPLIGWDTDLPFSGGELRRTIEDHTRDPGGAMTPLDHPIDPSLVDRADYGPTTPGFFAVNSFSDDVEKFSHNNGHVWACGAGHLREPLRSSADPLFYLLHSQIDREWAYWQRVHSRHGVVSGGVLTFPAPQHYDNTGSWNSPGNAALLTASFRQKGSFLDDGIWPWDGTTGGTPNTPAERPPNQATAADQAAPEGENVPNSMPLITSSAFPASVQANLWPAMALVPLNRHMIDYLGRFRPQDGLGFSYDDVPY